MTQPEAPAVRAALAMPPRSTLSQSSLCPWLSSTTDVASHTRLDPLSETATA